LGRRSDGGIFKDSAIGKAFDEGRMDIPEPIAIKEGRSVLPYFPLKPYLLRPYPGKRRLTSEHVFNYRLSRPRRVIENTVYWPVSGEFIENQLSLVLRTQK